MTTNDPYYDPYWATRPPAGGSPAPPPPGALPPGPPGPPPAAPGPRMRKRVVAAGVAAIAAAATLGGIAYAERGSTTVSGTGSTAQLLPTIPGDMNRGNGNGGTSTSVSLATAEQQKGVVSIVSVLKYQNAESAGTGMVLSSDGEILTNNHVINGATSVTVTVVSTGRSYKADVVGTDPSEDVAVLQLRDASGLTTANIGKSSGVSVGDKIVGVGNAGGTGTMRASSGTVSALNQSITATDETGQDSEKLTGLIEVKADIVSGDSGGPLYDASGAIVGMDTAASANQAVDSTAYAIPIDTAVGIADKIESGVETSTIHIGLNAFLGVAAGNSTATGVIVSPIADPATSAGIVSGSVITQVQGKSVASAKSLKSTLTAYQPGDRVSVTWTDPSGSSHTKVLTLSSAPAD
jgi:S1-C subfamily serine protease